MYVLKIRCDRESTVFFLENVLDLNWALLIWAEEKRASGKTGDPDLLRGCLVGEKVWVRLL
jgi:hypothetical protein